MKVQVSRASTILVLALMTITSSAYAERSASNDLKIGDQRMRMVVKEVQSATTDKPITAKDAQLSQQVVYDVANMVQPMTLPRQVTINLSQLTLNPNANPFTNELNMGVRFADKDDSGRFFIQNPSEMRAVVAHEFGHLVFMQNVLSQLGFVPQIVRYSNQAAKLEAALKSLRDEGQKIQALIDAGQGTAELKARLEQIANDFNAGLEKLQQVQNKNQEVLTLLNRTTPYNEFFADVVSVLYTESPNAIAKAIHFSEPNNGSRSQRALQKSEIFNREFEAGRVGPVIIASAHAMLFQVRQALWEEYLKRPSVMHNHKSEVIQGVARAILKEAQWITQQGPDFKPNKAIVFDMNKRLWAGIQAELGELN